MKYYISGLTGNLSRNFKFHYNLTAIAETIHGDLRIYIMLNSHRMKNVSYKSCRENQNTHFIFNNLLSENYAIYEIM
jgi:hypothetical protein